MNILLSSQSLLQDIEPFVEYIMRMCLYYNYSQYSEDALKELREVEIGSSVKGYPIARIEINPFTVYFQCSDKLIGFAIKEDGELSENVEVDGQKVRLCSMHCEIIEGSMLC